MSSSQLPSYRVNVKTQNGQESAFLEEATQSDIDRITSDLRFNCNWEGFFTEADFDCEVFIKLQYQDKIYGLIRFAIYPYPPKDGKPEIIEIAQIEAPREPTRTISPIGLWLIWYATKIAIDFGFSGDIDGSIILLQSLEPAIDYYRDKVMMEGMGWVTLAPGEEGYVFRFSQGQAIEFCDRIQQVYGRAYSL